MTEVARVETVLPSWRFLVTDAMGVEAEEFRRWVQSWPLYGHADDLRKFSAQALSWMPSRWPLICKLDQRLDGSISRAICHLAEGDIDTHQPGYMHLLGNMMHNARRSGYPDGVRKACDNFIGYVGKVKDDTTGQPTLSHMKKKKPMSDKVKAKLARRAQYVVY